MCRAVTTSSCARGRTGECGCLAFGAKVVARSAYAFDHTNVTQTLILSFQISPPTPPEVPHLCRAAATAHVRTRECGRLAFGDEVVARSAHVCDHTDVTQTLILACQIREPPEVPHLCRAAATRSCARGTRECGRLAVGAAVVARRAHVCDDANVTQTLVLAFQICPPIGSTSVLHGCSELSSLPPLYLGHRAQPHFPPYIGRREESPPAPRT